MKIKIVVMVFLVSYIIGCKSIPVVEASPAVKECANAVDIISCLQKKTRKSISSSNGKKSSRPSGSLHQRD